MEWVLLTGGNSSLGFSVAKHLSTSFNLVVSVRDVGKFQLKLQELKSINPNILLWICDFEKNEIQVSFKKFLQENEIKINHFVNFSGMFEVSPLRLLKSEVLDKMFKINVQSAIEISSVLAQKVYRSELKNVIFISTISAIRGNAGYSTYASSKSALHGFARSLSVELAPTKVNTIILGPVKTERTKDMLKDKEEYLNEHLPLGLANEDVLNPWLEFLLIHPTWMTGQEIVIDGGATVL